MAYTNCPDCARKGVTLRGKGAAGRFGCKFCGWGCKAEGYDRSDVQERLRWKRANGRA